MRTLFGKMVKPKNLADRAWLGIMYVYGESRRDHYGDTRALALRGNKILKDASIIGLAESDISDSYEPAVPTLRQRKNFIINAFNSQFRII
jgi:hypothetical protein